MSGSVWECLGVSGSVWECLVIVLGMHGTDLCYYLYTLITEVDMDKVVRDGKVAVLVTGDYGCGWYSAHYEPALLFSPEVVRWVEAGKPDSEALALETMLSEEFSQAYLYGMKNLEVLWLPVGKRFLIQEYDGLETLLTMEELDLQVA